MADSDLTLTDGHGNGPMRHDDVPENAELVGASDLDEAVTPAPAEEMAWVMRGPVIMQPEEGCVLATDSLILSGTAHPSSTISIDDWLSPIASSSVNADGTWSITLPRVFPGNHAYRALLLDRAGKVVAMSKPCMVSVLAPAPQPRRRRRGRKHQAELPVASLAPEQTVPEIEADEPAAPVAQPEPKGEPASTLLNIPNGDVAGSAASPDAEDRGRTPRTGILAVLATAIIIAGSVIYHFLAPGPHATPLARNPATTGTSLPASSAIPSPSAWYFSPLAGPADQVLLVLTNRNRQSLQANITVRQGSISRV
ncbi:MAG: hypothetical protein M3Z66_20685, partial [Chloroflexota bacterium]|nr:hypothetical protein [Chloroflexota bacterium]